MKDNISKALNLTPISKPKQAEESPVIVADDSIANDVMYARNNILKLIDTGMFTIERLSELADMSQDTEAYKSVAPIIKSMLDANRELLKVHEVKRDLLGENANNTTVINNNLVLTTKDVLELIKGANPPPMIEGKKDDV